MKVLVILISVSKINKCTSNVNYFMIYRNNIVLFSIINFLSQVDTSRCNFQERVYKEHISLLTLALTISRISQNIHYKNLNYWMCKM